MGEEILLLVLLTWLVGIGIGIVWIYVRLMSDNSKTYKSSISDVSESSILASFWKGWSDVHLTSYEWDPFLMLPMDERFLRYKLAIIQVADRLTSEGDILSSIFPCKNDRLETSMGPRWVKNIHLLSKTPVLMFLSKGPLTTIILTKLWGISPFSINHSAAFFHLNGFPTTEFSEQD